MQKEGAHQLLQAKAVEIARRLESSYATPDLGNKADPLDELIYIALTRQTHEKNAQRTWNSLRTTYPTWGMLLDAPEQEVTGVIKDGGFSRQKASWIKQSLKIIKEPHPWQCFRGLKPNPSQRGHPSPSCRKHSTNSGDCCAERAKLISAIRTSFPGGWASGCWRTAGVVSLLAP